MQTVYPLARDKFLGGEIAWKPAIDGGDDFFAIALDSTYTSSDLHEFRDALTGLPGMVALPSPTRAGNGWADASDPTITGMTPGGVVRAFVIARDVGSAATDDLIWIATTHADTTPISRVVDGSGSMTFSFANTPGRIFQLGS